MGFKVPLIAAISQSTAADGYFPLMNCQCSTNFTDEGSAETPFFVNGTLSNLYVSVFTNTSTGTSNVTLRKNGANGNMTLSFAAGLTGRFLDNTNTDSISNGDVACTFADRGGGGNVQFGSVGAQYETSNGVIVNKVGISGSANFATGTAYYGFIGGVTSVSDNTAATTPRITAAGTIKNLHAYSNSNARTNITTFRIRLNGVDGNSVVTFAAGTTGLRTNSTNSDTLSASDNLNFSRFTAPGSGTFTLRHVGFEIHYPSTEMNIFSANLAGLSFSATTARYAIPSGSYSADGNSTLSTVRFYGSGRLSDFYINASANTGTQPALMDVRLNNTTVGVQATFPASTAGTVSNTADSAPFANEDYLDYRYLKSTGTGWATIRWFSLKVTFDRLFKPYSFWF